MEVVDDANHGFGQGQNQGNAGSAKGEIHPVFR
jgi:hypothetical protein